MYNLEDIISSLQAIPITDNKYPLASCALTIIAVIKSKRYDEKNLPELDRRLNEVLGML